MNIVAFEDNHIVSARLLAKANYEEEREAVPELPFIDDMPKLEQYAENKLGVAAIENELLVGFLCCEEPWEHAFGSNAIGAFSPIHAHGAVKENREMIYKKMYQKVAEIWVERKITYHAIACYAHDFNAVNALFTYSFGLRCIDAIRPMETFECPVCEGITYEQIEKADVKKVMELRRGLLVHMGKSPCFMYSSSETIEDILKRKEKHDSRLFIAKDKDIPIAFLEVADDGENYITESDTMLNIKGAFCEPEYRGKYVYQNLLNFVISRLKKERIPFLGVDFESINPTANGFWLKYFKAYTHSVVRRIEECAIR